MDERLYYEEIAHNMYWGSIEEKKRCAKDEKVCFRKCTKII